MVSKLSVSYILKSEEYSYEENIQILQFILHKYKDYVQLNGSEVLLELNLNLRLALDSHVILGKSFKSGIPLIYPGTTDQLKMIMSLNRYLYLSKSEKRTDRYGIGFILNSSNEDILQALYIDLKQGLETLIKSFFKPVEIYLEKAISYEKWNTDITVFLNATDEVYQEFLEDCKVN